MLKHSIKDAVATLYDEQGTHAANRYSTPEELAKALLDLLFPQEAAHNTEVTGVAAVPKAEVAPAPTSDTESTDSKKARKQRAPMTDEAKAAMKAKREATIAAKKAQVPAPAAPAPAPAAEAPPAEAPPSDGEDKDKKERKKRGPMSDEAKAAMKAKREATIAAKKAAAV